MASPRDSSTAVGAAPASAPARFRPTECRHPLALARITGDLDTPRFELVQVRCNCWACEGCGRRLRQLHRQLVEAGFADHAARGDRFARLLTVTWPTDSGALIDNRADCANVSAMIARFIQEIRRTHHPRIEYYAVKEPTKRGRLHDHLLTFGPFLRKCRYHLPGACVLGCEPDCRNPCHRPGGCQADPNRPDCVQAIAHRLGLGWVDVRKIRGQAHAANYISKYLGKHHIGRRWPRYSRRVSYSRRFAPTTIRHLAKQWSAEAYRRGVEQGHIKPQTSPAAEHSHWRLLSDLIRRGPPVAWIGWPPGHGWEMHLDAGTVRHLGSTQTADLDTGEVVEVPWSDLTEAGWLRRAGRRIAEEAQAIAGPTWETDLTDPQDRRQLLREARRRFWLSTGGIDIETVFRPPTWAEPLTFPERPPAPPYSGDPGAPFD